MNMTFFHKRQPALSFLTILVTIVCNVVASRAMADFDTYVTTLLRTYSPGLSVNPNFGYSQRLWGDTKTPFYGYVRPYVIGVLSPSVYEGKVGVEIFPVSFLGVDVRRAKGRRFINARGQDCDQVECQGELNYTDVSFQMFLGYKKTYASIRWTQTAFDAIENQQRRIYEFGSSVLLNPDGDRGDYLSVAIGEDLGGFLSGLSFGLIGQSNRFHKTDHLAEAAYLFSRIELSFAEKDESSITLGVGAFRSSLNVTELSVVAAVVYSPLPGLGFGR